MPSDYNLAQEIEFINYLGGWASRDRNHVAEYHKQTDQEKLARLHRYLQSTTLRRDRPPYFGDSLRYLRRKIRTLEDKINDKY